MDSNQEINNEMHKTPPRFVENFHLDIREEMGRKNGGFHGGQGQSSPFTCMPNISTPPSQFLKIRNPFEAALNEKLHLHIFSPSVFTEARRSSEKFKWTIDDLSSLRPAPIDVSTVHHQVTEHNSEDETSVQAKIEQYFSETHTVPSPWNENDTKPAALITDVSPCMANSNKEVSDGWSQTVLTLPPILPKEVEDVLKPFCTFTQEQFDDRNSSLCRKLFNFHEESVSSSHESEISTHHSDISIIGSPVIVNTKVVGRNFDESPRNTPSPTEISPISNSTPHRLSTCKFSPISSRNNTHKSTNEIHIDDKTMSPISRYAIKRSKSISRLDFSGHMSVDTSFNMAPENDILPHSLSESPLRTNEYMENSCNWDMEYNNLSLNGRSIRKNLFVNRHSSPETIDYKMDISHHQTPKSKLFPNQRKLSDSFKLCDSDTEDDETDHNQSKQMRFKIQDDCKSSVRDNLDVLSQNTQDTGYNTCSELSQKDSRHDDDMIVSDLSSYNDNNKENIWNRNIFASTPTKIEQF